MGSAPEEEPQKMAMDFIVDAGFKLQVMGCSDLERGLQGNAIDGLKVAHPNFSVQALPS